MIVLDLNFRVPNSIADILGTVSSRFAQRKLFLHPGFLAGDSFLCPSSASMTLSWNNASPATTRRSTGLRST